MNNFVVQFFGCASTHSFPVPPHVNAELEAAETPEEIERIICEHEESLAQLRHECDEFLVCDTAAELMSDVLDAKNIPHKIICGINDEGNSHSYVRVGDRNYDPTHQGFGEEFN